MRFALLAFVLAFLVPQVASACSCVGGEPTTDAEFQAELDAADVVFEGKAQGDGWDDELHVYTFEVLRTFKGSQAETISIASGMRQTRTKSGGMTFEGSSCDSAFDPGRTYLVFAYKGESGSLSSAGCSPTQRSKQARHWFAFFERAQRDSEPPAIEPSAGCRASPPSPAGLVVFALVVLFRRRRASRAR